MFRVVLLTFIFCFSTFSQAQSIDSINVVHSISELKKSNAKCSYLRTYQIDFGIENDLNFEDKTTKKFLKKLARFIKANPSIENVEIIIHMSLSYPDAYSYNISKMWKHIKQMLIYEGVEDSILTGINYRKNYPLITKPAIGESNYEFRQREYATNRRVEFKVCK